MVLYNRITHLSSVLFSVWSMESSTKDLIFSRLAGRRTSESSPAKSTASAETFAYSEAFYELIMIHDALQCLLRASIKSVVIVHSKDLYNALSSKRSSVHKAMRSDINYILFIFDPNIDVIAWIRGRLNMADVATKPDYS